MLGREIRKGSRFFAVVLVQGSILPVSYEIDGDVDRAADNGKDEHDITAHLDEAQEDGSILADLLDQHLVGRLDDGLDPAEDTIVGGGRRTLFVCVLDPRRVHGAVVRPQQAEQYGAEGGKADRITQGRPESRRAHLERGLEPRRGSRQCRGRNYPGVEGTSDELQKLVCPVIPGQQPRVV